MTVGIEAKSKSIMVERATLADVDALLELGEQMVAESRWPEEAPLDRELLRRSLTAIVSAGGGPVADADTVALVVRPSDDRSPVERPVVGGLIGAAVPYHLWTDRRYAQELAMWVHPSWRRRGAAANLIEAFEGWAREHGLRRVFLGAGDGVERATATEFYASIGYRMTSQTFSKSLEDYRCA